jgi:hypothetical protein
MIAAPYAGNRTRLTACFDDLSIIQEGDMARRKARRFLLYLIIIAIAFFLIKVSVLPRIHTIGKTTTSKVYVALGFHTSLYHSYRGDTDDEAGFGKDIEIIRKTIATMNERNKAGSNVKAVWDFDNLFTLEEILPKYAPDIIGDIKHRVQEGKDEVILMSYDNGLASAMTKEELTESITKAITNPNGSGVNDIFGKYTPIVRPQEGMTSTGSFGIYKNLGIKAVALYYSAIPFDNLRVFLSPLSVEEALNPLTYKNKKTGDEMTIIPTYNVGDLIENVSLTKWARDIHRKQLDGTVKGDVLIFINFDADDSYWKGYNLPIYLKWLPNTGGLAQLIDEADAADYIEFTTLDDYLKTHKPKKEIFFGQDTADGTYDGYNPWAEKTTSHDYWTSLMEDRRNHKAAKLSNRAIETKEYIVKNVSLTEGEPPKDQALPPGEQSLLTRALELRMRLLSTTHFGMATPLLCAEREFAAERIIKEMLDNSRAARESSGGALAKKLYELKPPRPPMEGMKFIDSFMALTESTDETPSDFIFITFDLTGLSIPNEGFYILGPKGRITIPYIISSHLSPDGTVGPVTLFFSPSAGSGPYFLFSGPKGIYPVVGFKTTAAAGVLTNGAVKIEVSKEGIIKTVVYNKRRFLNEKSLLPRITYHIKDNKSIDLSPKALKVAVEKDGTEGVARIRIFGDFEVPEVKGAEPGFVDYRLTLLDGVPYLFFDGEITYPNTPRNDLMGLGKPIPLLRKIDHGWYETAPAELIFTNTTGGNTPFEITKRDYLGVESSYTLDYFKHSDVNRNLSNVNNHITAEYAAVSGGGGGIGVALDNTMLSSFAFLPAKLTYDAEKGNFSLRLNPFGTYSGPHYYHPTWGTGLGYKAAFLSGESYASSAPSYNGKKEHFALMVSFFDGATLPEDTKRDLITFADPPIVISGGRMRVVESQRAPADPAAPEGIIAAFENGKTYIIWNQPPGEPQSYKVYLGTESGKYTNVYETKDTKLILTDLVPEKTYYVSVAALFVSGKEMGPKEEISFIGGRTSFERKGMDLPISLQLKILWQGLLALIN